MQAPRRGEQDTITYNEVMLKVHDLKFTHDSVDRKFRNGSSFDGLMRDLRSGRVDPQVHLKPLKVYHWPGRGYYSRDNRRLKCLKQYQQEVGHRNVFVRAFVFELPASTMERLDRHKDLDRNWSNSSRPGGLRDY